MKQFALTVLLLICAEAFAEDADIEKLRTAAGSSARNAYDYGKALQEQGRHADAVRSFRKALDLDSTHEGAHKALGHEFIEGKWVTRAERDKPRRADRIKELVSTGRERFDHDTEVKDCAPFLLCIEKSPVDKGDKTVHMTIGGFELALKEVLRLFNDRFGDLCEVDDLKAGEVFFVYIFADRQRYLDCTHAPARRGLDENGGHFDRESSTLYLCQDANQLYETLMREGVLQLLAAATQRVEEDPAKRRNSSMGWFTEGVATDFQSFNRGPRGECEVGACNNHLLRFAQHLAAAGQDLKLSELLAIADPELARRKLEESDLGALKGQAWAFWYFLQTAENGKFRTKLDRYIVREMEQKGGVEAAKSCFGDLDVLDGEYREFLNRWK